MKCSRDNDIAKANSVAARLPELVERAEGLAGFKLQAIRLAAQKEKLDRSEIQQLEEDRDAAIESRGKLASELSRIGRDIGFSANEIEHLAAKRNTATGQLTAADALRESFSAQLNAEQLNAYWQRYERERTERAPKEIHETFERQRRIIESRIAGLRGKLIGLKAKYVERHGLAASIEGAGFEEFAVELELWRESRLPSYREKIAEAKTKALQQLAEDIVFRLRENLILVRRQIEDLNKALKDVPFGSEQYQFTVEIDPAHRDFHNLVMDAGRFEKESLFGAAALAAPELKETLGNLLDRLVEAEAKQVKTELEAKADYREYFNYDLKILHADGRHSFYDKVAGDKSGGETQTPYYIAVLTSMYRLYRSRSLDGHPTCGLVLLDEAFGKMDESRIAATLTFARNLDLQLVLATPKERSELVAPRVERSLLPEAWAEAWVDAVEQAQVQVITTIENEYPFFSYVEEAGGPDGLGARGEIALYTAGFPTPGLMSALRLLRDRAPKIRFRHWGDADVGGLRIWWFLRSKLQRPIELFRTTAQWLKDEVQNGGKPLSLSERAALTRLKGQIEDVSDDDVSAARDLIESLSLHGLKLEQERF